MSVVIVTGAAGGIGQAIVDRVRADHEVVAADLDASVEDLGGDGVEAVVGDLTVADGRRGALDAVGDRPLVGLVNAAGITRDGWIGDLSADEVRLVLRVNAIAPIRLAIEAAERMEDGGAIVNLSSRAHLGNFGQVNYSASKGALVGATRALARRLAPRLRVNAIAPGLIRTPMTDAMPDKVVAKIVDRVPLKRIGEPEEVAATVADLLDGGDHGYLTGQVVYVCGGRSI